MGLKFIEAHKFYIDDFLDNSYFEKYLDTSSEWIEKRTGIFTRQFSKAGNDLMALDLAKKFKNSMQDLDLIICASLSLIHISEPTRRTERSRMPSSA